MAKNIYIAATGKDVGKSTISYAIMNYLIEKGHKVSFMKPVGQRWKKCKWGEVEEDVILIKDRFNLEEKAESMNPVVVRKGFTEEYLFKKIKPNISSDLTSAYQELENNSEFVVIEGTGHAGVGSVLDHSNADVAKLLDAKVVLIAKGGIGKAIDKLELTRIFFENRGAKVIGVIINKVIEKKIERVEKAIKKYCSNKKLKYFGTVPYSPILGNPTLGTIIDELKPKIYQETGEEQEVIEHFMIGASHLEEAIDFFKQKKGKILLILPSDRIDLVMAIPNLEEMDSFSDTRMFTILFSGKKEPSEQIISILKKKKINLLWKKGNTYDVVSKLSSISIKTRPQDKYKLDEIERIVAKNIEIKNIMKLCRFAKIRKRDFFSKATSFIKKIIGRK